MFSPQIRTKSLILMCRSLSTTLYAGLDIKRAFKVTTQKLNDPRLKLIMEQMLDSISHGSGIGPAMKEHGKAFPELMINMVTVAEETGHFPEVLKSLAEHYEKNIELRRDFISKITMPVIQTFAAIFIIALMLLIIGLVGSSGKTSDPLGFGLTGTQGAQVWLLCTLGPIFLGTIVYLVVSRALTGRKVLHGVLMKIPVVKSCMHNFAIARFSWAFALTQQTGQSILKCVKFSLDATGNGVYMSLKPQMVQDLKDGDLLSEAMRNSNQFTEEYLQIVEVAEEGGTVPEQLERVSPQLEEAARRSLSAMATAFSWLIRCLVGMFIVFLIFRMAMNYINLLTSGFTPDMRM